MPRSLLTLTTNRNRRTLYIQVMVADRGGIVCAMDHRYCIDNGAMIAQAGVMAYQQGYETTMVDTTVTQRFRTDQTEVKWREP